MKRGKIEKEKRKKYDTEIERDTQRERDKQWERERKRERERERGYYLKDSVKK